MDICVTPPSEVQEECETRAEPTTRTEKYSYPEFAGWQGERYLKKLLRQILPMALYRTWEICADHQAPGNDCYVGITYLAEVAGRAMRTMEKNLAALCARRLLVERIERKVVHTAGGRLQCKVVVIKDFTGLYSLAHDYHEWLEDVRYLPPQRGIGILLAPELHILARLRRFENYRRVLFHHRPGRVPQLREEDCWFTDYRPHVSVEHDVQDQTRQIGRGKEYTLPAKDSAKDLSKEVSEDSPKRISESLQITLPEEDSHDSALSPSKEALLQGADREPEESPPFQEDQLLLAVHPSIASGQTSSPERETKTLPPQPVAPAAPSAPLQAHPPLVEQENKGHRPSSGQLLAQDFVHDLAAPFGDKNPQGTRTRIAALLKNANLEQPAEVLPCLIRAYVVARDTGTIRSVHCDPKTGQANRMPLFCAMVQRLSQNPQGGDRWQRMEADIATDAFLTRWWHAHRILIGTIPAETGDGSGEPDHQPDLKEPDAQLGDAPSTGRVRARRTRRPDRSSKTKQEQVARTSLAHQVLIRLLRMAIPIQEPVILWEHLLCGCPLYHTCEGREGRALCSPDPTWPEEALAMIRSIVDTSAKLHDASEGDKNAYAYAIPTK